MSTESTKDKSNTKVVPQSSKLPKLPSSVVRIHAALCRVDEQEEIDILKEYGGVKRGETITRDILIPATMPLWVLHFVLQRSFGFTHSHLYRFENEKGDFGTGFHEAMDPEEISYEMYDENSEDVIDFPGGSLKRWLKEMYTGPFTGDGGPKVKDCLPLTYVYDFGDNWHIYVKKEKSCDDLVKAGVRTEEEISKAIETVRTEKRPIQVAHDGDMLIEDVMSVYGFCRFLRRVKDVAPPVIKEKNDWIDPDEMGYNYPDAYLQPEYENADEWYLEYLDRDDGKNEEPDESGMTPIEHLNWAYSQGWHREDYTDFDLL